MFPSFGLFSFYPSLLVVCDIFVFFIALPSSVCKYFDVIATLKFILFQIASAYSSLNSLRNCLTLRMFDSFM